jgi:hypothetical protein
MPTTFGPQDKANLRRILEERFSLEELKTLASDLGVNYDRLPHETLPQFSVELVRYFEREGNPSRLVTAVQSQRPDAFPPRSVEIKFVVAAMLQGEAGALISGDVLQGEAYDEFQQFLGLFSKTEIDSWLTHYDEKDRNEWQLHVCPDCAIKNIAQTAQEIVQSNLLGKLLNLRPCSDAFFNEKDEDQQTKIWKELRVSEHVMIVDAISVFHPRIRDALLQSQAQAQASIVVISPFDCNTHTAQGKLEDAVRRHLKHAFARFNADYDDSCEIGVGNERALKRWLVAALFKIAQAMQDRPSPANSNILTARMRVSGRGLNAARFNG